MRFERDFVQIPNTWVRDDRISFKARGIRDLLLSHKDGYVVTLKGLAEQTPKEGIDSVRTGVEELEEAGYLVRTMSRGRHVIGTVTDWELRDPFDAGHTTLDHPTSTGHHVGSSNGVALDHPTPVRTPSKNTNNPRPKATTVAREASPVAPQTEVDGSADPLTGELPEPFVPCPARSVPTPCSLNGRGVCIDIARHPKGDLA
jgi:hypothetical protein